MKIFLVFEKVCYVALAGLELTKYLQHMYTRNKNVRAVELAQ